MWQKNFLGLGSHERVGICFFFFFPCPCFFFVVISLAVIFGVCRTYNLLVLCYWVVFGIANAGLQAQISRRISQASVGFVFGQKGKGQFVVMGGQPVVRFLFVYLLVFVC